METIVDYVHGNLNTFEKQPFNEVDSLTLSQISYLRIGQAIPEIDSPEGIAIRDLYRLEVLETLYVGLRDEELNRELVSYLAASPRFRDVRLHSFVNDVDPAEEKQFAALTAELPTGESCIVYRGTDSTLVGWKEDFNMGCLYPIPSQLAAKEYFEARAAESKAPLLLSGHSKGGNLALYAAMECSRAVQDRIVRVYNHDGPGFAKDIADMPEFKRIEKRVKKTMPTSSVVGMMLQSVENYTLVVSSATGIMAHDPYTWSVVVDKSCFELDDSLTYGAIRSNRALEEWMFTTPVEKREVFIDTLFNALKASGAQSFGGTNPVTPKDLMKAAATVADADPETRAIVLEVLATLAKAFLPGGGGDAKAIRRAAMTDEASDPVTVSTPEEEEALRSEAKAEARADKDESIGDAMEESIAALETAAQMSADQVEGKLSETFSRFLGSFITIGENASSDAVRPTVREAASKLLKRSDVDEA